MKMFFLGIMIMSLIGAVGTKIADKKNNFNIAYFYNGVFGVCLFSFPYIKNKIYHYYRKHSVKTLIKDSLYNIKCIDCEKAQQFLKEHRNYTIVNYDSSPDEIKKDWDIKLWEEEFVTRGKPNMRYVPKEIWKRYEEIKIYKNK